MAVKPMIPQGPLCERCGCNIMPGQKHEPNGVYLGEEVCYVSHIVPIVRKPGTHRSKVTKGVVRATLDRFLQAPGIATATDAHAAIDRYAMKWKDADNADQ